MKKITFIKGVQIKIHSSFYFVFFICIFFQIIDIFIYTVLFVFLHELAHVFVAKKFSLNCKKINITPIGQVAIIDSMEKATSLQKLFIVSAGVILNLVFAFIFSFFYNDKIQLMKNINLAIAFFNIIPIYPLDGGRFVLYFLGKRIGDLMALNFVKKMSKVFCFIILLVGVLQVILFPYNFGILCIGLYFFKVNKNEYINTTFEIYKNLIKKEKFYTRSYFNIKEVLVFKKTLNREVFLILSQDYYLVLKIIENGLVKYEILETEFIKYIEKNGLTGCIEEISL